MSSFEPAGAVTGVGSLPIAEPEQAVAFVAAHAPEVPFWPQLPVRSPAEGMLRQTLGATGDLIISDPFGVQVADGRTTDLIAWLREAPVPMGPGEAAGLHAFVRALHRGGFPGARALKGQLTGPLTLGWFLTSEGGPAVDDADLFAALVDRVAARAAWQAELLAGHGLPALVVVDEPALGLAAVDPDHLTHLQVVLRAIDDGGAIGGVHTCAAGGFELPETDVGVISLDLHQRTGLLPAGVRRRWADGGLLAAGLVPTVGDQDDLPDPSAMRATWLGAAAASGDLGSLAARTLVTATCGLAGVGIAAAEASFALAHDVGQGIRLTAGSSWAAGGALRRLPHIR